MVTRALDLIRRIPVRYLLVLLMALVFLGGTALADVPRQVLFQPASFTFTVSSGLTSPSDVTLDAAIADVIRENNRLRASEVQVPYTRYRVGSHPWCRQCLK